VAGVFQGGIYPFFLLITLNSRMREMGMPALFLRGGRKEKAMYNDNK